VKKEIEKNFHVRGLKEECRIWIKRKAVLSEPPIFMGDVLNNLILREIASEKKRKGK
jgi:hypothetical protein